MFDEIVIDLGGLLMVCDMKIVLMDMFLLRFI